MFKTASPAFLAVPNPQNKRVLVEGKVKAFDPTRAEVEFEQIAGLSPDADVTLFAEKGGKFFQQAARVCVETFDGGRTTVAFELFGEPVSAEQRGSYRTSAVMLNVPIGVDRQAGCVLADVSPEGVGVITPKPLTVGSTVSVTIEIEAFRLNDTMKVQGVKRLPSGKLRFGLFVPGKGSNSRRTLEKLASHLQRVQLKRLSGAA